MRTTPRESEIEIVDGVARIDGRPIYLSSVDYPYYRDDPDNWAGRLDALSAMGHRFVTAYVPWRHHELEIDGGRRFDFSGETKPSRNVVRFLELAAERDLLVILKPGPFVHAELNYGGLPDFVCPVLRADIEPMLAADGTPVSWGGGDRIAGGRELEPWPLPAPFDPVFSAEAEAWFGTVRRELLERFGGEKGPIALIQLANEGIYSNGQHAPWAYDYSQSSIAFYRSWLTNRYGDLDAYRRLVGRVDSWEAIEPPRVWRPPTELRDVVPYRDWSAYQADYLAEVYRRLQLWLGTTLPCLVNVNPPLAEPYGIDAWLSRYDPDRWPDVHYGFTDWIGVASDDPAVVDRYEVMVRRARGPNLEENWGISDLYDSAYAADVVPFHQTLLVAGLGGTGHNVYPGVRTTTWEHDLDRLHDKPYAPTSPITEAGSPSSRAATSALLNGYFERYGAELLECHPAADVALGLYLPHAQVGAWLAEAEGPEALGLMSLGLMSPGRIVSSALRQLRAAHIGVDFINLETCTDADLAHYRVVVVPGGQFMARDVQERLARAGGNRRVVIVGRRPDVDERLEPCELLGPERASLLELDAVLGGALAAHVSTFGPRPVVRTTSAAMTWMWVHPKREIFHLFVLTTTGTGGSLDFEVDAQGRSHHVSLSMPGGSGAIVRIVEGRFGGLLVKGQNERTGESVRLVGQIADEQFAVDRACDLLVHVDGGAIEAWVGTDGEAPVAVTVGETVAAARPIPR
jgi:beta-galactosidase